MPPPQIGCIYCGTTLTDIGIATMDMNWPDGMSEDEAICCDVSETEGR